MELLQRLEAQGTFTLAEPEVQKWVPTWPGSPTCRRLGFFCPGRLQVSIHLRQAPGVHWAPAGDGERAELE